MLFRSVILKCDLDQWHGDVLSTSHLCAFSSYCLNISISVSNLLTYEDLAQAQNIPLSVSPGWTFLKLLCKCLTQCLCSTPGRISWMAEPKPCYIKKQKNSEISHFYKVVFQQKISFKFLCYLAIPFAYH